jgi:hypothetical protein
MLSMIDAGEFELISMISSKSSPTSTKRNDYSQLHQHSHFLNFYYRKNRVKLLGMYPQIHYPFQNRFLTPNLKFVVYPEFR